MESIQVKDLEQEDLASAAEFYARGVLMQVPPGSTASLEELTAIMTVDLNLFFAEKGNRRVWLAVENDVVKGVADFFVEPLQIRIKFIGALPPRKGIGTFLMYHLGQLCSSKKLNTITAEVSQSDPRARNFYFKHLGFQDRGICHEEPGLILRLAVISPENLLANIQKR